MVLPITGAVLPVLYRPDALSKRNSARIGDTVQVNIKYPCAGTNYICYYHPSDIIRQILLLNRSHNLQVTLVRRPGSYCE